MAALLERATVHELLVDDLDGRRVGEIAAPPPLAAARGSSASRCEPVALPAASAPHRYVGQVLPGRRAHRFYDPAGLEQGHLHAVCQAAVRDLPHLGLAVVVTNVSGLDPAIYGFDPAACTLTPVLELPADPGVRESWVLQREFASAPVVLLVLGSVGSASTAVGSHGYRRLLVDAGSAAQQAWLAAERRGLVASTFAGLLQPALRELVGIDGWVRTSLLGLAVGGPVPAAAGTRAPGEGG